MEKVNIGLIRVLTTDDESLLNLHGNVIMEKFPSLNVISKCIPDQYEGIHSEELCNIAVPKIVELAKSFENIKALIISCADDPAVEILRKIMDIPIIGAGESALALALQYGGRIGILGITDYATKPYAKYEKENPGSILVAKPVGVNSTLDLMTEEGRNQAVITGKELKDRGAKVIALACTGLSTIKIAQEIERAIGVTVIDPVFAEGLFAYFEIVRR